MKGLVSKKKNLCCIFYFPGSVTMTTTSQHRVIQVIFRLPSAPESDGIRDSSIYQVKPFFYIRSKEQEKKKLDEPEGGGRTGAKGAK